MNGTLKIYRVNLRGFSGSSTGVDYSCSYVLSENPDIAYKTVREWLDGADYGFQKDRELKSIELIAEAHEYADCQTRLFIQQPKIQPSDKAQNEPKGGAA
jgi:hypothetical protein